MDDKCCICGEWVENVYSSMKYYSNGEIRSYIGHKDCLRTLNKRLIDGIEIEYELIRGKYKD